MNTSPLILAAFLTPGLFYGGLAAVSAPILIHLLARRRFKRIRWAAMEFLIDAERRNRRRLRMEEWILLALRCLAVFLIGLMLARPFVDPAGLAATLGGSQRTERVFVLDDSFSMMYADPNGSPFERSKAAVRRIVGLIRRDAPDDPVTLVRMSDVANPIESGTYLDDSQTEELFNRLEALAPTQRAVEPADAVEQLAKLLDQTPGVMNVAVYWVSDFQRHQWQVRTGSSSEDGAVGVMAPLSGWAKDGRGLRMVLVDVRSAEPSNTAIADVQVQSGQLVAGSDATIRATVVNYGNRALESGELQGSVGNLIQPSKTLPSLGPYQTMGVDLRIEPHQPGFDVVRLELPADALSLDNVRYLAAEVVTAIRILVVNGEASPEAFDDEVTYLSTALRPEGEQFSGNELTIVDETEFEDQNLSGFHLIVMANVYRLSEPAQESLDRFVRGGGGLLVFVGDQIDADWYNGSLYRDGSGPLPCRLTEVVRAAEAAHLVLTDRLHPALRGLSLEGDPLGIGRIPFLQYYACQTPGEATIPEDGTGPAPTDGSADGGAARVLARFDDAERHPAIVERTFGSGRTMLVTTTGDKEWHLWPDHPTFLPVLMELARHTARRINGDRGYLVGDRIELELDPAAYEADVKVRTPAYPNEREVGVAATAPPDGRGLSVGWDQTDLSGVYQFVLRRRDGAESVRMVAVNVDANESDLTGAEEAELHQAMGGIPHSYIRGLDELSGAEGEARAELWRLCWIGVVMALLSEHGLAWFWGRKR